MRYKNNFKKSDTLFILFVFFIIPIQSQAYLDPGSGSYFIQIIIAVVAGSVYAIRHQFSRIGKWIGSLSRLFTGKWRKE